MQCRVLFIIMLNVVMRIVIVLGVVAPYLSALRIGGTGNPLFHLRNGRVVNAL
jgi:hypothetical protein